jgi:hypothetical protein
MAVVGHAIHDAGANERLSGAGGLGARTRGSVVGVRGRRRSIVPTVLDENAVDTLIGSGVVPSQSIVEV